ncbi:sigma-70 family RNA polymerase sigma factor [Candidatus Latescibacterota bacterium]
MTEIEDLVTRTKAGDLPAYGLLVERFQRMAIGYAASRLGDFHLAEDVAQEAFIHAYLAMDDLRSPGAFPGWLRRIVTTYCSRLMRRPSHRVIPHEEEVVVDGRQDTVLEQRELGERLRVSIAELPESERAVTHLYYFEDLSQKEIASFLELPLTTVKYRLYSSRQRLRLSLAEEFDDMIRHASHKDTKLADRVTDSLDALEALHKELSARFAAALSKALDRDVAVEVSAVEQTTAAGFMKLLPTKSCTYQFTMSPLEGGLILDIGPELACAMAGHDQPGPMTGPEYALVVPTLTTMFGDLETAWEGVIPVKVSDIELEVHPSVQLDYLDQRETSEETVVHVELRVEAGNMTSAIHMSYPATDLERIQPFLAGDRVAKASDLPRPEAQRANAPDHQPLEKEVRVQPVTPDNSYVIENMIPLWMHDQAGVSTDWDRWPNKNGVFGPSPATATLRDLCVFCMYGWRERPNVYHPALIVVGECAAGFAVVESPPVAPDGVDHYLTMFFLHHVFREGDTATQSLQRVFDRHRGEWEINTAPRHYELHNMLHRVLADYAPRNYRVGIGTGSLPASGYMAFRFNNA